MKVGFLLLLASKMRCAADTLMPRAWRQAQHNMAVRAKHCTVRCNGCLLHAASSVWSLAESGWPANVHAHCAYAFNAVTKFEPPAAKHFEASAAAAAAALEPGAWWANKGIVAA
eukprot:GHRR01023327.1.p1 GENE.GHRR01023327.1~~GHRR01023327.1.p1  ORF type:complete len:114 (-),score=26.65 GHRR01023327.1:418-759(-)